MNKNIVIVGGGAGGLELVARLYDKFKHNKNINIILIDAHLKHVWKPMYHEVAAGTLLNYYDNIDYISYSYLKGFKFILGKLKTIDNKNNAIVVESIFNESDFTHHQSIHVEYDILVLAIGSQTNDFNIPGVKENCLFLDSLPQAELIHEKLLKKAILLNQSQNTCMNINIIGGGATGVELAAELNYTFSQIQKYSKKGAKSSQHQFNITVIEAGERILNALPKRISQSVNSYLQANHIKILVNTKITAVEKKHIITAEKEKIQSDITIWAAGIKGNGVTIAHSLEVNQLFQFSVKPTLQTTMQQNIFAFGDCAHCPQLNKFGQTFFVPPRAQAAHQQANLLIKSLSNYLEGKILPEYHYLDYGSLISLSKYNVVGNLMSKVTKNLYLEGFFARVAYWLLYKKHLIILKGLKYVLLSTLATIFIKKQRPEIKLH